MKTKYILIGIALVSMLSACSRDEENLFDKSAAERAQAALDNANTVLLGSPTGWECLYFANRESRGYNMILEFRKNGSVKATAKNELTTKNKLETDTNSLWVVTYDYGPILSFNTYNSVLHAWADPQTDGDGYLGDYEFLILSATPERVVLKGKKHSGYTILRPMPEMDADDYFTQCNAKLLSYFGEGNILTLQQGNGLYYLHEGSTGLFNITAVGEPAAAEDPTLYPICPTLDGFMMSYGFNENKDERLFTFDTDKFVGEAGSIISAGDLNMLYMTYIANNKGWTADLTVSTGAFADAVTAFQNQLVAQTGDSKAKLSSVAITFADSINYYEGAYLLRIKYDYKDKKGKKNLTADFLIDNHLSDKGDQVVIAYNRPHNTTAETWYNQPKFPEMAQLVHATMGTFTLEALDPINPAKALGMNNGQSVIVMSGSSNLK